MAADVIARQFVQLSNAVVRDNRLSFKARGIFALIASHRDGFGISEESIAALSTDGLAAVRSGLKELIAYGYLRRSRKREENGRLGRAEYYITDMPEGLVFEFEEGWDEAEEESSSSEPECENSMLESDEETGSSDPTCDSPTLGEPRLENQPHKKTSPSKKTSDQVPPSPDGVHAPADEHRGGREAKPASPDTRPPSGPQAAERGTPGAASETARKIASAALQAAPLTRPARVATIAARIDNILALGADPDRLTEYLTVDMAGVRSVASVVEHRLALDQLPPALFPPPFATPGQPVQKPWCGKCDEDMRWIETTQDDGRPLIRLCACNPRANAPAPF
jgi:hypothetical protein